MKHYIVKFVFEIPVEVEESETVEDEHISAYYVARESFNLYNTSEANIQIVPTTEDDYTSRQETFTKLRRIK